MKTKQNILQLIGLTSILAVTAAVAFIANTDAATQSMGCGMDHGAAVSVKQNLKGAELMTEGSQPKEHASKRAAHGCCPMMGAAEPSSETAHKHASMASASCCSAKHGADASKSPQADKK